MEKIEKTQFSLRKANQRGLSRTDWLESYHSFSFNRYYDPAFMNFRHLRVINDDMIAPGGGFPMHPHQDMEIITYVVEGALEHKDSLGHGSVIKPGEIQRMTAGQGIWHSEFNPSKKDSTHLYQIWITPELSGLTPEYEQISIDRNSLENRLKLIASHDGRQNSVTVHQDINLYSSNLNQDARIRYRQQPNRHLWLQLLTGEITVNDVVMVKGDGLSYSGAIELELTGQSEISEFLLFDLS